MTRKRQRVVTKKNIDALKEQASEGGVAARMAAEAAAAMNGQAEEAKTGGRKRAKKPAPSELERRSRRMYVTFSDGAIPDRLRALAERWEVYTKGNLPNVSAVIEYLLLSQLAAAERGEIDPPEEK